MIRAAAISIALTTATAPTLASGQVGCLPPEEPFAYEPPRDDPELRDLIDEQYQDYINGTEAYLNCLNREATRARTEFQTILNRYIQYFGSEAGVEFDAPG